MAIQKTLEVRDFGVEASYHRIIGMDVSHIPELDVSGCKGSVYVRLACYANKETRDKGGEPLATRDVRLRFGAKVKNKRDKGAGTFAIIPVDEPTRADIYAALTQIPDFEDAVEA